MLISEDPTFKSMYIDPETISDEKTKAFVEWLLVELLSVSKKYYELHTATSSLLDTMDKARQSMGGI